MLFAYGHEPNPVAIFVLYLLVHLGFVVWAIRNRHAWWAVGIFLFPVVGDLTYLIYYFATKDQQRSGPVTRQWEVRPGDVVQNRASIRIKGTSDEIPRGSTLVVTELIEPGLVEIEQPNGLRHNLYTDALALIRRGGAPAPPRVQAASTDQQASETPSYARELRELASLRDEGIISEEEFTSKKRQILGL